MPSSAGRRNRSSRGKLIDGRHHGLAVGCFIEGGAAGPKETAKLEIGADGAVTVFMGSSAVGQGVETVFAQIAADALEIPIERITDVFHGSTAYVSDGYGAYHSRSIVMGGSALLDAVKNLHEAIRGEAAKRWGCAALRHRDHRGPSRRTGRAERDLRRRSPAFRRKASSSTRSTPTPMARTPPM